MSHIVKDKDGLRLVKDIFYEFLNSEVDISLLEETVINLLPKDMNGNLFSKYEIKEVDGGYSRFCLGDNYLKNFCTFLYFYYILIWLSTFNCV